MLQSLLYDESLVRSGFSRHDEIYFLLCTESKMNIYEAFHFHGKVTRTLIARFNPPPLPFCKKRDTEIWNPKKEFDKLKFSVCHMEIAKYVDQKRN